MSDVQGFIAFYKNVPMDREYKNVLNPNYTDIEVLLKNRLVIQNINTDGSTTDNVGACTFNRVDGTIKVGYNIGLLKKANYIKFTNNNVNGDNMIFYAWIDNLTYVSDGCTKVNYTIDIWTTYTQGGVNLGRYDTTYPTAYLRMNPVLTLREIVADDTIGSNLTAENIPIPNVYTTFESNGIANRLIKLDNYGTMGVYFLVSKNKYDSMYRGGNFGGVFSGLGVAKFSLNTDNLSDITDFIDLYSEDPEDIVAIYAVPDMIYSNCGWNNHFYYKTNWNIQNVQKQITASQMGYKNNKILTYPYTKLHITNNNGTTGDFAYENFYSLDNQNNIIIDLHLVGMPSPTAMIVPRYYQGVSEPFDSAFIIDNFPQCSWVSNYFENWKAINSAGINYSNYSAQRDAELARQRLGVSTNIALAQQGTNVAGSWLGALASGGLGIGSAIQTTVNAGFNTANIISGNNFTQKEITYNLEDTYFNNTNAVNIASMGANPVHGSTTSGSIDTASEKYKFNFYHQHIIDEYLKPIDDYFTMFGYAVNKIKIPNIAHRQSFNYFKVDGELFTPNSGALYAVPSYAIEKLNDIARKGITLWNDMSYMGDYSVDNSIWYS